MFSKNKIELHAHFHGSIRLTTAHELLGHSNFAKTVTLDHVFHEFRQLHTVVSTKNILKRCIREVCDDFISEDSAWVEIRTSPRASQDFTKREFVRIVLDTLQEKQNESGTQFRLILSIDRYKEEKEAYETIELAREYSKRNSNSCRVVGIDLSGDPKIKSFSTFEPYLHTARSQIGLGTTIHVGEVPSPKETREIIQVFRPERVGHALFLDPESDKLVGNTCAIETCPSSNIATLNLSGLKSHPHLEKWLRDDRRICVCTDDRGIFQTTLSNEIDLVHTNFGNLTSPFQLSMKAAKEIFGSDEEKQQLIYSISKSFSPSSSL